MGQLDERVHRRVDRRRRAAATVAAVVECRNHLVFAIATRINGGQGAQSIEAKDRQSVGSEGDAVLRGAALAVWADVTEEIHQLCAGLGGNLATKPVGAIGDTVEIYSAWEPRIGLRCDDDPCAGSSQLSDFTRSSSRCVCSVAS